ncbi:hypothetical protein AYI69_g1181 [Smittium culicis]|uniref:Uncharacterized protein n=1 Tax=Smittium culicis TaxID=133412 RepID=A0A1R1YR11_9FUNG|nr:hypothetical protein AYI69_g1181 [Smittium culicis]
MDIAVLCEYMLDPLFFFVSPIADFIANDVAIRLCSAQKSHFALFQAVSINGCNVHVDGFRLKAAPYFAAFVLGLLKIPNLFSYLKLKLRGNVRSFWNCIAAAQYPRHYRIILKKKSTPPPIERPISKMSR